MEGNYTQRMSLLLTLPLRWSLKPNWSWRQLEYFAWLWQRSFTDFCPAEVLMLCVWECVSVLYVQIQIGVWPRQTYVLQHILYFMCEICCCSNPSFYMSAVTYISCFNLLQERGLYCGLWWSGHYGQVSMERGNWNSIKHEKLYLPLPLHKPYPSNNNRLTLSAPYLVQHIWSYVRVCRLEVG